jgi:hypothetical protein
VSVKNVTVIDLALVEMLDGRTEAPAEVLAKLAAKGHLTLTADGKPALTAKGRDRATKLAPNEHDMRLMFRAEGAHALTAPADCSLHIGGGGPARIRS